MKKDKVQDADCVRFENFLLLPSHLERLQEVIRIQKELDPNRKIPAFKVASRS